MPHYQLFHPDTEILGQAILDFETALGSERFRPILEKHGLTRIDAQTWYPAQKWLDALSEIAETSTAMLDFVSLGIRQLELAVMPPEFEQMPLLEVLESLDAAYRLNYRGTDIGGIRVEVVDGKHVKVIIRSFEPDNLWYGNMHGLMRRFAPPGSRWTVYFDPDVPRREQGGEETVIHIKWT